MSRAASPEFGSVVRQTTGVSRHDLAARQQMENRAIYGQMRQDIESMRQVNRSSLGSGLVARDQEMLSVSNQPRIRLTDDRTSGRAAAMTEARPQIQSEIPATTNPDVFFAASAALLAAVNLMPISGKDKAILTATIFSLLLAISAAATPTNIYKQTNLTEFTYPHSVADVRANDMPAAKQNEAQKPTDTCQIDGNVFVIKNKVTGGGYNWPGGVENLGKSLDEWTKDEKNKILAPDGNPVYDGVLAIVNSPWAIRNRLSYVDTFIGKGCGYDILFKDRNGNYVWATNSRGGVSGLVAGNGVEPGYTIIPIQPVSGEIAIIVGRTREVVIRENGVIKAKLDPVSMTWRVYRQDVVAPANKPATEQASGSYTENNYGGLVEITPVSCWKTTPDQSVVKVPDSVPSYFIDYGTRNGVKGIDISIYGVVLSGCEMEKVHRLDKDTKDFYQVKLTFSYRRSNGYVGNFSVHRHLKVTSGENNIVKLEAGKFPFALGTLVDVQLAGIPDGSEEKNRKWLEGLEKNQEAMLSLFNYGKKPFNPSQLIQDLDDNEYIDLAPEVAFLNRITDRTGLRK